MRIARPLALALVLTTGAVPVAAQTVEIAFYCPVVVGGPVTKIIERLTADFERDNPGIKVKPVYTGSYVDGIAKALAAAKAGAPPQTAILLSADVYSLIDTDAILPWDDFVSSDEDKAWMDAFFPAFMLNSRTGGKTWSIPFQRSTIVLYWNKEAFKEAGLDPNRAPATWAEQLQFARRLTLRDATGRVTRWGIQVPSTGYPYWLFQGFTTQNDVLLMNGSGTQTYFDKPAVVEALQYWVDLAHKHKVMPAGLVDWATTPRDFLERRTAMMWTTTGNLTNVKNSASFAFGVAMLPAGKRRGSPTGGGNFFMFRQTSPAQRAAVVKFVKWMTSAERAAQWSIDTGYVAVRRDAWTTPLMKQHVGGFPAAAVARDQLRYAVAELSTHDNQRVIKALDDNLQAALTGVKTPAQALNDAQVDADRILKRYRR
ncbi:MAG TPA: ABC transporter substrate-binding protein [Methylomirabilota bacterium]|nr:ABC transporter substrate-binding protein [Methylomirabilota bacterium]